MCAKTLKFATNELHTKDIMSYKKIIANRRAQEIQVLISSYLLLLLIFTFNVLNVKSTIKS